MKIYINARFLTQTTTGVQRYAHEFVKALDALLEEGEIDRTVYQFILLSPKQVLYEPNLRHITLKKIGFASGHFWEQLLLPFFTKGSLLLNLCNTGPMLKRKQIATIHDTAVFVNPDSFSMAFRLFYKLIQTSLGLFSRKIVTVSNFSKTQLIQHCHIKAHKISIVNGGKEHMLELIADERILAQHQLLSKRYVLAVSSMNPSKNFANIVRAFQLLQNVDYEIVIAGGTNARVFGNLAIPSSDKVKLLGYVSDVELKTLYEHAACFIFPSFYEGFGLPPLEAMTCGSPVIVSLAASLPEVCGEASLYCNPYSPMDMAFQIERLMNDPDLQQNMRLKGLERAKQFTWQTCARRMFHVIEEVAGA
ncbi:glycosyltransferase family 1 protein [Paenibacillus psychroresistens]|uniref:Glycosyltransferase family 1 protein n=1 Tax=Paenibacillus psychroresistens TaxID=1778678 RepID=A0A6B8RFR0_9BACL|nr:glycosyltransferase family 1 protein [Paenibacillus psychroresistens]QGQ94415.1 glycosyltransferase family 1 protein [Paenibacillus psychroresistens]